MLHNIIKQAATNHSGLMELRYRLNELSNELIGAVPDEGTKGCTGVDAPGTLGQTLFTLDQEMQALQDCHAIMGRLEKALRGKSEGAEIGQSC